MAKPSTTQVLDALRDWHEGLRSWGHYRGLPAKGGIAAALVVSERLKSSFDLSLESHRTRGGSQISGVSGAAVKKLLARHGEMRRFLSEGGRTNRGGPEAVKSLFQTLQSLGASAMNEAERLHLLECVQGFLVSKVREYHELARIKAGFEASWTTHEFIARLMATAKEEGKHGPVAQHLVGAKLQLRFPDLEIENRSFTTADDQSGRPGDYFVGETAFHVTVAPTPGHYERCERNIREGYRVYLLVPENRRAGAMELVQTTNPGKVTVETIESFVAQNLDEISQFSRSRTTQLKNLIEMYNGRVREVEADASLQIELPGSLRESKS